LSVPVEEWSTD